ncbi:MAG TPA: transcriptional regulator GcvA [Alphaproteobacteria bacterium]|nr:transcriptional regulator GcvA [Alphaproteobacteria bacterium]
MRRQLPPLNAVRAFEAAARHLSFTKAAEELFVTPAAVSQQVKLLEGHLGQPLFRRLNRAMALTDAGRLLMPRFGAGLDEIAQAVRELKAQAEQGPLDVNTSPAFASKWLIPRLDTFQQQAPEVEVRITASMELVDFDRDEVDAAIRFGAGEYPGLAAEWLMGEEVFPVCAPALLSGEHPLKTPDDLKFHQLLHDGTRQLGDLTPDWRMWLQAAGVEGVNPNYGMTLRPGSMVVEAALEGQGVALGRRSLVAGDLASGRLVRPFALSLPITFSHWLVYKPEGTKRPKVKAFRDWLVAEAEASRRR